MAFKNIEHLRTHGPTPGDALPGQRKPEHRRCGVRVFRTAGARGKTVNADHLRPIYYLDTHGREAVVRAFAEAHPNLVDTKSKEGFVRICSRQGRSWKEAARTVADSLGLESHTVDGGGFDSSAEHICPACGEDVNTMIPNHLTNDCEAT